MPDIPIDQIKSSPAPVRTSWDDDKMAELAASIAEQGVIVPVKVRPDNGAYELVYGHRRVEAARRAGLTEVPAIVEGVDDTDALIQALIENVQREDMQPMDTARALRALMDTTGWSQGEVERQGIMAQARTSWTLDLLSLPTDIQDMTQRTSGKEAAPGTITERHVRRARDVLGDDAAPVLRKAANEGLASEQTRAVAEAVAAAPTDKVRKALLDAPYSPHTHDADAVRENPEAYTNNVTRKADQSWMDAPGVSEVLTWIKAAIRGVPQLREAGAVGKVAPEHRPYIIKRLRNLAAQLTEWADELEALNG